jgi:hypothetical protein
MGYVGLIETDGRGPLARIGPTPRREDRPPKAGKLRWDDRRQNALVFRPSSFVHRPSSDFRPLLFP